MNRILEWEEIQGEVTLTTCSGDTLDNQSASCSVDCGVDQGINGCDFESSLMMSVFIRQISDFSQEVPRPKDC